MTQHLGLKETNEKSHKSWQISELEKEKKAVKTYSFFYAFTNAELNVLHTINTVLVNILPRELQLSNTKHKLERFAPTRTNPAFYTLKVSKSILNDVPVNSDGRKTCKS